MSTPKIRRSVLIAAAGALAVSSLFAGRLSAGQTDRASRGMDMAPRLFARVARRLDLTEDQQARIRAILQAHAGEIEAQARAGRDARRALGEAAIAEPVDEAAIRGLARELGDAHAGGALLFARIRAQALPILTPEQQEKLRGFRSHRLQRGDEWLRSLQDWLKSES